MKRVDDYATDYAVLKFLGYDEVTDLILDLLVDEPNLASYLFTIYGNFVVVPATDSVILTYNPAISYDKADYSRAITALTQHQSSLPDVRKQILPTEVGRFLSRKLALHCSGFNGCISMIDRYSAEDLQKLLAAILDGCERNDFDLIMSKSREVENVFDNIWNDSNKISQTAQGTDYGVLISIGLVGALATLPIGGIGGILASLGFSLLEKHVTSIVSNKLARAIHPHRMVAIYDFKQRYNIP
jgi:hypothetical protein